MTFALPTAISETRRLFSHFVLTSRPSKAEVARSDGKLLHTAGKRQIGALVPRTGAAAAVIPRPRTHRSRFAGTPHSVPSSSAVTHRRRVVSLRLVPAMTR